MLVVHTCPSKDPISAHKDQEHKTDNYFRVRRGSENHVFPFSNANSPEARWACEESRRVLQELGGSSGGAMRSLWKSHPDFRSVELVGEGGQIEASKMSVKRNALRRASAQTNELN